MALVKCRECGAEVSSEAPTCPKCGIPSPRPIHSEEQKAVEEKKEKSVFVGIFMSCVLVLVVSVIGIIGTMSPPKEYGWVHPTQGKANAERDYQECLYRYEVLPSMYGKKGSTSQVVDCMMRRGYEYK